MLSSKIRLLVIGLVLVVLAGAGFGLYKYRSAVPVDKSSSHASTPQQYSITQTSPANATTIGVSITCTAKEVQNQLGNTTGWDVSISGDNVDMAKQSTTVKLHVPWNTTLEGQDHVTGTHRYDGPTPPVVVASAETFAAGTFAGALAQCDLPIPTATPQPTANCDNPWEEDRIRDLFNGFAPLGSFDYAQQPTNTVAGGQNPILVSFKRSADKTTLEASVQNDSDECLIFSVATYKMYDGVLEHQKYFNGRDNIVVQSQGVKTVTLPLPSCMTQIDMYGVPTAPRQLLKEYGVGAGPVFMGGAFHLNKQISYMVTDGPLCTDTPTDREPVGSFDLADCQTISGWAVDQDEPARVLDVHVYREAAAGQPGAIFVGSFKADQPRPDVNTAYNVTGSHGFSIATPAEVRDGQTHKIYVYAINPVSGKNNPLLSGSPKTVTCPVAPPPPTGQCKLDITKSTTSQTVKVGGEIEYIIDVKNSGSANCTGNVKIEDTYDAGVTFVRESHSSNVVRGYAATNTPFHNTNTRTLAWDANVLSAGEAAQIKWYATANSIAQCAQATLQNKARVTAKEYNNLQDFVTSNTVATTVSADCPGSTTDVGVTKTASPSLITLGQTTTFTIKVTNNGPLAATNVVLKDALPAGLSFVSFTVSKGTFTTQTNTWDIGALAVSEQQQLQIVARGDVLGTKVNTATLTTILPSDSNPANNQAQASVTVVAPQIAEVSCAPGTQSVYTNQTATFAAVGGNGTYAWSAAGGNPATGSGSAFSTQYSSVGQKSVIVTSGDKQAICTVIVSDMPIFTPVLDIAVTKQVSPAVILVGQWSTFTMTATNRTQVNATNVRLTDILPQGLTLVAQTTSQGNWNTTNGVWDVGNMAAGATVTATLQVTGNQVGSFTNRIDLTDSVPNDTDSSNNSATATLIVQAPTSNQPLICAISTSSVAAGQVVTAYASGGNGAYAWTAAGGIPASGTGNSFSTGFTTAGGHTIVVTSGSETAQCLANVYTPAGPASADLSLRKTVTPATIASGEKAIFAITVTNDGPGTPSGVTVKDVLPTGVEYISYTATRGDYAPSTGVWTIGTIGVGEQVTLLITVKSVHVGQHINTAEVCSSSLPDTDSLPCNANPNEDDQASATLTVTGGLVNAGLPIAPLTTLGMLCAFAALCAIKIKTQRQVRLQTPMGEVSLDLEQ